MVGDTSKSTSSEHNRIPCSWRILVVLLAFSAVAHGDPITILWDDFEGYQPDDTTWIPPVGQPWKLMPAMAGDLGIVPIEPEGNAFFFGLHRNRATAPFSAADRELIAAQQNATLSFDYLGFQTAGMAHYFDIAAYDPVRTDPVIFLRFSPDPTSPGELTHNVLYRDPYSNPSAGLIDTGLDVLVETLQSITLSADIAEGEYLLDIEGNSAVLPMYFAADEIASLEFSNYGVALSSGTIDNVRVSVDDKSGAGLLAAPEMATAVMLAMAGLVFVCARMCRRQSDD